jgi:hypothetical protein
MLLMIILWMVVGACASSSSTTTSSGGGGGGGGGSSDKFSRSEGTFILVNGEKLEFYFTITNSEERVRTIEDIFVKGENAEYVSVVGGKGDSVSSKGEKNITVDIDAPAYFSSGKYLLQFDVVLKDSTGT